MVEVGGSNGVAEAPFAVVRSLPVVCAGSSQSLPFLFVEAECGDVIMHTEALVYARASLSAYNLATIEHAISTLGRFYDFVRVFVGRKAVPLEDVDYLIYAFLTWRYNGTLTEGGSCFGGLRWMPLASEALRREYRGLARYFRFSALTWGHVSLGSFRQTIGADAPPLARLKSRDELNERDFLIHLSSSREYWARQHGIDARMPPVGRPTRRRGGLRHVMPEAEVWAIIQSEANPVFRALWIVGAFGGIRISEQLNAWQIDVLPGTLRKELFGYEAGDNILFLRADPAESRYVGDVGKAGLTRRQFLREHYRDMLPRPEYDVRNPLRAGWKGTIYLNDTLRLSEVFWLDKKAVSLFEKCASEIREFHRHHRTSEAHPYFYVNLADPTGQFRSDILKVGNVESAWERACRRCGLEPHTWGRNIHGLRHFYKAFAEDLGISRDNLQIMMGHKTIGSQDEYGREARKAAERLCEARQRRQTQSDRQSS